MKFEHRLVTALIIFLGSAVFAGSNPAIATDWDIYLVGGQSNAAGWGTRASGLPTSLQGEQTDVNFFYSYNGRDDSNADGTADSLGGGSWGALKPGTGNGTTSFGPEITLGRTLADENPTRDIAIIKYASGGSNLATDWDPANNDADPIKRKYERFLDTYNNAIAALPAGDTYTVQGMAWMQGESDADATKAAAYETNLTNFISQVRTDVGAPNMHFSIGQLGSIQPGRPFMPTVQNAQAAVAARDANVSLVDTSSLGLQGDDLHFTNNSQQSLGVEFAAGVQGKITGIQVANPSFEFFHQENDGNVNGNNVSAWVESGGAIGNFNPNTSYYSDTDSLDSNGGEVGTMDGENALFFANDNSDEYVTQTLSSMAEVGATYELTVAVGDRDESSRPDFAGYTIQLLSDGQVLADLASTQSLGEGTFTDISLFYTVVDSDPLGPLGIRLGTNGVSGGGSATDFDNVRLTVTSVPEPGSLVALALAGLASLLVRRR